MPNYNDRRYRAEEARREAEGIQGRYGLNARTMPHIDALTRYANNLDEMNEREMNYGNRYDNPESRRRENPGPYNPQDYPRGPRGAYDETDMRHRDGWGRFADYDENTHMMVSAPYHSNAMPNYYPNRPQMHGSGGGGREYSGGKIGFGAGEGEKKHRMDRISEALDEVPGYYEDYLRHKQLYEQSKDPQEKQHMLLELQELTAYFGDLLRELNKKATTPEEKQYFQQMAQKMMQP